MASKQTTTGMTVRTGVKAGGIGLNHSKTQAGMVVRTGVKGGGLGWTNHSKTQAR